MKKNASKRQMHEAFGYSDPDRDCSDWFNDSIAAEYLDYRSMGCLCCDHNISLKTRAEGAPHRANEIHIKCEKGHLLVVAVMKED